LDAAYAVAVTAIEPFLARREIDSLDLDLVTAHTAVSYKSNPPSHPVLYKVT
jgi:hypothetical protein